MADRATEMVRLICKRKGTYDSGEIYDALFTQTRGNPPLDQRGIARLISCVTWSRATGERWRAEGLDGGTVERSRKLKTYEYQENEVNGNA